jgi:hypothetical protein
LSLSAPLCCGVGRDGILGTAFPYAYEERLGLSLLTLVFCLLSLSVSFVFVCAVVLWYGAWRHFGHGVSICL